MKKFFVSCMMFLLMSAVAYAEKGALFLHGPEYFQIMAVSPNGKWACGIVGDGSSVLQGLLWNIDTGETTYLSLDNGSTAMDVTDDGLVVGSFTDNTLYPNGASVSVAGYYKDGKWTRFDNSTIEGVSQEGGEATAVSDDGRVAVGALYIDGKYRPVKWEDGVLKLAYKSPEGVACTVTGDGTLAAGWSMESIAVLSGDTVKIVNNRTAVYWSDSEVYVLGTDPSIFDAGRYFSPDKSKLLCNTWGHSFIYDLNTQQKTEVPWHSEYCSNQYLSYIDNNGMVTGGEEETNMATGASDSYGYIYENGTTKKMTDWLAEKGVTLDYSKAKIIRAVDMSVDHKTMGVMTYLYENGIMTGVFSSAIIKLDYEIDHPVPVALTAAKLNGLNNVRLAWKDPLVNAENVVGYNVYRNGVQIQNGLSEKSYMDLVPADGTYAYTVTALYEGANSDIVESDHSEPVTVEVAADEPNAIRNLESRQVGYKDLKLRWLSPESNLPSATYFDESVATTFFGGGTSSFSAAIRLGYDFVQNYADEYSIARVAFMPGNAQAGYSIVVYADGKEIYRQAVADEALKYQRMNIVNLNTPVKFSKNQMIYVAIEVDASRLLETANDVLGMNFGTLVEGYSDLVRQLVEPEFYSLNRSAIEHQQGEMPISWAISAIFAKVDAQGNSQIDNDIVVGYDVYRDGEKLATALEELYVDGQASTGKHQYGVEACYADGSRSARENLDVDIVLNESAYNKAADVKAVSEPSFVKATWNAPRNNDRHIVSYCGDEPGSGVKIKTNDLVEYTVAATYPFSYIDWYEGYSIKSLRFYPTAEAVFTFVLEVNGEDGEMISVGELGQPDGYALNQWNEYELKTPVVIRKGEVYRVKLICSEVDPTTTPISLDKQPGVEGVSDLISLDYAKWESVATKVSVYGNWMIGMVIDNGADDVIPVDGYNVLIDGQQVNSEPVKETYYMHKANFKESETHRLKVNVIYPVVGEVEGDVVFFSVAPAAVESISIDRVKVYPNPAASYLRVEGQVDKLVMYDMAGRKVAETSAAELNVTELPVGNYLLNVYAGETVNTVKVAIVR